MQQKINAAIIGASGYTGAELVRLLHEHPYVHIHSLTAESNAGKPIRSIYPHMDGFNLPEMVTIDQVDWPAIEVAFCCLPHATSHKFVQSIPDNIRIIDLSADFRFSDTELYEKTYNITHQAKPLQQQAVYGLSEIYQEQIKDARIIACPGCYPTSALLPLMPLIASAMIDPSYIIVDAKSAISGAGRKASLGTLFTEVNDAVKAYNITQHRHAPEMELMLQSASQNKDNVVGVQFTPQLVPMNRGILSTIYIRSNQTASVIQQTLAEAYQSKPFVTVYELGSPPPSTREVYGTNQCRIAVFEGRIEGQIVICSVIDNLVKGAAGQAVQNMNIAFGYEEITGLNKLAICP